MNIVKPYVELLINEDNISHVAKCARVCYQSDGTNNEQLYNALKKNKHNSMFRHETHYFIVSNDSNLYFSIHLLKDNLKFGKYENESKLVGINIVFDDIKNEYYIVCNGQYIIEHSDFWNKIKYYEVNKEIFINNKNENIRNLVRYTFKCITQISTSRELNRVSPNNIAEQSTRYVYENGTLCLPYWLENYKISKTGTGKYRVYKEKDNKKERFVAGELYLTCCEQSFDRYKSLIVQGINKQDARGVLPLDTKTEIVYTYSIEEWKHIINLRYYGITGKPHHNAKIIAGIIKDKLNELGYNI